MKISRLNYADDPVIEEIKSLFEYMDRHIATSIKVLNDHNEFYGVKILKIIKKELHIEAYKVIQDIVINRSTKTDEKN